MMKNNIPIPDVVTNGGPLDNNVRIDFDPCDTSQQQQTRTDPPLYNQLLNRIPRNAEVIIQSASIQSRPDAPWREVSGDWRNLNSGNASNVNDFANHHSQSLWYDGDQMDVPLLNPVSDDSSFGRELDSWDHCHQRSVISNKQTTARNQLIAASVLCLIFMIAEAIGGYLSNSLAVMTDAAHMLSDFTSFLVSLFALWISQRPPSRTMSFGYYRAEILGALLSVLIIWVLTGVLVYMAVYRLVHGEYDINADTMIIVSGIGVVMNIAMGVVLHGGLCSKLNEVHHGHSHGGAAHGHSHNPSHHPHSHSHEHSHGHQNKEGPRNMNVRAALIHVIGDLVQSIGVLIAAFIIKYRPDLRLADPICTFLFSGLVLATTVGLIRDALRILMEGVPRGVEYRDLHRELKHVDGVSSVHSLHVWSLTLDRMAVAVHLAVCPTVDSDQVLKKATRLLQTKFKIAHCTVQVERYNAITMESCPQCTALSE